MFSHHGLLELELGYGIMNTSLADTSYTSKLFTEELQGR